MVSSLEFKFLEEKKKMYSLFPTLWLRTVPLTENQTFAFDILFVRFIAWRGHVKATAGPEMWKQI